MNEHNHPAQPSLTDDEIIALEIDVGGTFTQGPVPFARAIESALLSKLRGPVADVPAQHLSADELTEFMGDPSAMSALADGLESIKGNENAELAAVIVRHMASAPVAGEAVRK